MLPWLQLAMKYHKFISDASLEIWLSSSNFTECFVFHSVQKISMCKHGGRHAFWPGLDADSHLSCCSSLAGVTQGPLQKSSSFANVLCKSHRFFLSFLHSWFDVFVFIPTATTPGQTVVKLYVTCNEPLMSLRVCDHSLPTPLFSLSSSYPLCQTPR